MVLFGRAAERIETFSERSAFARLSPRLRGAMCWLALVAPPALIVWATLQWLPPVWQAVLECAVLYFTIGWKSMRQHAMQVYAPLRRGDLGQAREAVRRIVSRETANLNERDVASGAVEAVLENGTDCVLSPIFWYLALGAPGALLFRLANTLDAMWGMKSERYLHFGWTAARADDVLNWIPARLTAAGYAITGRFRSAFACAREQKAESEGPNAGLVMAAGAGALQIRVGGPVVYRGTLDRRPVLGAGREVEGRDIPRSISLVWRTLVLWTLAAASVLAVLNHAVAGT